MTKTLSYIQRSYQYLWTELSSFERTIILSIGAIGCSSIVLLLSSREDSLFWGFLLGFSTNLITAPIGYIILRQIDSKREQEEKAQVQLDNIKRLFRQLKSKVNSEAIRAAEELTALGVFQIVIETVDLNEANLQSANLERSKLPNVQLFRANLAGASLQFAQWENAWCESTNFQGAFMFGISLNDASLVEANLEEANLNHAKLQNCNFRKAKLLGANLCGADLTGANFAEAQVETLFMVIGKKALSSLTIQLDTHTVLPDGSSWTEAVDFTRFTNPAHPKFWKSTAWTEFGQRTPYGEGYKYVATQFQKESNTEQITVNENIEGTT